MLLAGTILLTLHYKGVHNGMQAVSTSKNGTSEMRDEEVHWRSVSLYLTHRAFIDILNVFHRLVSDVGVLDCCRPLELPVLQTICPTTASMSSGSYGVFLESISKFLSKVGRSGTSYWSPL